MRGALRQGGGRYQGFARLLAATPAAAGLASALGSSVASRKGLLWHLSAARTPCRC